MAEPTAAPAAMGSTQPELSRYLLDSSDIEQEIILHLFRVIKTYDSKTGKLVLKPISESSDAYDTETVSWFMGKLRPVMGKNLYLSFFNDEVSMNKTALVMAKNFSDELLMVSIDKGINAKKYTELKNIYFDNLDHSIRRPLHGGDRNVLTSTSSETVHRVQQAITQTEEKKGGGLMGLLGR